MGMFIMYLLSYVTSIGHSINVLKQTQQGCSALFIQCEQGLQETFQLKYIAMVEAEKSEQSITAQKYIDQLNLQSLKTSIMRNYVEVFPVAYRNVMEYSTWEELEDYVNKFVQDQKGTK